MCCGPCVGDEELLVLRSIYMLTNGYYIDPNALLAYNTKALTNLAYVMGWNGPAMFQSIVNEDGEGPAVPPCVSFFGLTDTQTRSQLWRSFIWEKGVAVRQRHFHRVRPVIKPRLVLVHKVFQDCFTIEKKKKDDPDPLALKQYWERASL